MVVADPPLESGRAAGRLDAAYQARRGERVQCLVHRLQGHVTHPATYPCRDALDAQVVTVADSFEQRDPDGGYPQAGAAQLIGGGRSWLGSSWSVPL